MTDSTQPAATLVARLAARDPAPRRVQVTRVVDLDAASTFALLADVRNHVRWIPLTHGRYPMTAAGPLPAGPFPVGTRFTMISGPGRGLPDRMIVTELRTAGPGAACTTSSMTLRKAGPVLLGAAGIIVEPSGPGRSRVTWWEDAYLAGPVPARVTRAVVGPVLGAMMRLALARFAREVAAI
ncbi:Polyketide cyclase / dehydrase and lipid transport [Sanguibacter gelidistatuariae]|uniref:Polyketide cyclase / dehydrase and lipid transport n=1 Tax=Sanguibacter gelidistatuariae TaxID=1814289 RepID=A0A1G6Q2T3_9MICO|nr:SRPBCC family protein [Sanguibacter gelidistatuariae]SDC86561.1 Polyketide cyclase / dehydrase and lipid transport [Sanguibacter gelidistatuariae]